MTLVMSYFETSDRLVLSVFVGSTGLIVFFWFLTKSIATAEPAWIAALVLYVVAVLYLMPTIRGTVVTIEDVDKASCSSTRPPKRASKAWRTPTLFGARR